jgi:hypothetical protein
MKEKGQTMPTKKKLEMPEQLTSDSEPVAEVVLEETPGPAVCGHINKQHYNTKGKLEDLPCTLTKGHEGDHSAEYVKLVGEAVSDEKGRVVKVNYSEEQAVAYWGNAAGTPASKIQAGEIERMTLLQKDLVMQRMSRNPDLSVAEATAQAKASPEWTAAERS